MSLGPTTERVAAEIEVLTHQVTGARTIDLLRELLIELDQPLRVAVTGRVNAGKSTLVNALLRQRIAPTDVSECTRYATWFRFGTPERVEVVGPDGTRRPVQLRSDGRLPASLGDLSDLDVARIDVFLSNETLRTLTLIDTPGLASSRDDVQTTNELLALDRRSRVALAEADAMVFVVGGDLRSDEHDLLDEFRRLTSGLAPTSINTLAVVSRVDHAVDVGVDPIDAARARCRHIAVELRALVSHVLPLVGLLAETADSGALTDTDLLALAQMTADPKVFDRALLTVDRFVRTDLPGSSEADRNRLLDLLDLHGLRMIADNVHSDGVSSADLVALLRARSGISALRTALVADITAHADLLKANWAIGGLHDLAYRVDLDDRDVIVDLAERLELAPEMQRVAEIGVLREVAAGHPDLASVDVDEVRRLVSGTSPAERLGDDGSSTEAQLLAIAVSAAGRWRSTGNDGSASPSLRSIAAALSRSYELLSNQLRGQAR